MWSVYLAQKLYFGDKSCGFIITCALICEAASFVLFVLLLNCRPLQRPFQIRTGTRRPGRDIFTGTINTVNALYNDTRIGNDRVYISVPPNPARQKRGQGLIYFPNASGIAPNGRVLADEFARFGYTTIIVDTLNRYRERGAPKKMETRPTPTRLEVDQRVERAINHLRTAYNCTDIGAVAYCAGGPMVMRFLVQNPCHFKSVFIAHPAGVVTNDYSRIQAPLSLANCRDDGGIKPKDRLAIEDALNTSGLPWQMDLFSGVQHGFASRLGSQAHGEDQRGTDDEVYAKLSSFQQAVLWFENRMPLKRTA